MDTLEIEVRDAALLIEFCMNNWLRDAASSHDKLRQAVLNDFAQARELGADSIPIIKAASFVVHLPPAAILDTLEKRALAGSKNCRNYNVGIRAKEGKADCD